MRKTMRKTMRVITIALSILHIALPASGQETGDELGKLQSIYREELAKATVPLMLKYKRALSEREEREIRSGNLDSALGFRNERLEIEAKISDAQSSKKGSSKLEQPSGEKSWLVNSEGSNRVHTWSWDNNSTRRLVGLLLSATAQGSTRGRVDLHLPSGDVVTVCEWTGNESEFRARGRKIKDLAPLRIDVRKHTKHFAQGEYKLLLHHESGEGGLRVFRTQASYEGN